MIKKMMRSTNLKILLSLAIASFIGSLIIIIFFNIQYLYSFQFAYLSSALVMFASLAAYKKMVDTRVEHNVITYDDSKDVIDHLEDPYDLYSEEVKSVTDETLEEKDEDLLKRRSLYQTLKDTKAALSVYRLGAYAVLILGFLYLNRQGLLHIPSYIIGLGIPSIVVVAVLLKSKA